MLEGLPRPTCAAGITWEWVWVEGRRRRLPPNDLEVLFDDLGFPRIYLSKIFVSPVYFFPPPPLSLYLYNRTCPNNLPTNGKVFSWSPRAPTTRRSNQDPDILLAP